MIAVPDVSGMIEILFETAKMDAFCAVLNSADLIVAPDLFIPELTNTIWKYTMFRNYPKDECLQFIHDGISYIDKFIDSKEIWQEAFSEGVINKHPPYDMLYMVTARRHCGILITNDGPLANICKKNKIQVCN